MVLLTLLNIGTDLTIFTIQQTYRFVKYIYYYNTPDTFIESPDRLVDQTNIEALMKEIEELKKQNAEILEKLNVPKV